MAVILSGTKTVSTAVAPHLSASTLTTLCGTAVENLTVAQLLQLVDVVKRVGGGFSPTKTIGSLLS